MAIPDGNQMFIGDGGLETVMIFEEGLELPEFASFTLLRDAEGRAALRHYYEGFLAIAAKHGTGFTFDPPTWRASEGWGAELGYSAARNGRRQPRSGRVRGRGDRGQRRRHARHALRDDRAARATPTTPNGRSRSRRPSGTTPPRSAPSQARASR